MVAPLLLALPPPFIAPLVVAAGPPPAPAPPPDSLSSTGIAVRERPKFSTVNRSPQACSFCLAAVSAMTASPSRRCRSRVSACRAALLTLLPLTAAPTWV